jgi:serine/threonine protein kinase
MRESTNPEDLRRNLKLGKMLNHEASIMENMKHERIVLFIGLRIAPLSLVMEYLPLGTLNSLIAEGKDIKSWELRYQMMLDICEGMEFLHAPIHPLDGTMKKQCFHQDLKTGNVLLEMVDGSMRAKITDFGLSCMYSSLSKIL